jgi:hypothetical protein
MTAAGGDQHVVARPERDGLGVALEAEPGAPAEQQDPFVARLVVPAPGRRRVTGRDDPLEPERGRLEEDVDELLARRGGPGREDVVDGAEDSTEVVPTA